MNILFLTTGSLNSIEDRGIYPDLLREFRKHGHSVFSVSTYEKRIGKETELIEEEGYHALKVKVGNLTKCNIVEKGISTMLIEYQYKQAIKRYFSNVKFDLVLYSTPPITLVGVVKYIKRRDLAKSYLMLKDIFPQNAVDLGILRTTGIKGILYKIFRNKEKKLYEISDYIGCMSQANVDYVLKHNPELSKSKVGICPNCIEIQNVILTEKERISMRAKYGIPVDKKVFVYGGNLGKPQGISFIIDCLRRQKNNDAVFFLIVGSGTEFEKLQFFFDTEKPQNMKLMSNLPTDDYEQMIAACDVGLIFLDHRFTIPNFPSRLLSYMQAKLPVLAATDSNTDIGEIIVQGEFGWWCESNDVDSFEMYVNNAIIADCKSMKVNAIKCLEKNYTVDALYKKIIKEY